MPCGCNMQAVDCHSFVELLWQLLALNLILVTTKRVYLFFGQVNSTFIATNNTFLRLTSLTTAPEFPFQMSSSPEKTAAFLDVFDMQLPWCIQSSPTFVNVMMIGVYWQTFSKLVPADVVWCIPKEWLFSVLCYLRAWRSEVIRDYTDFWTFLESFHNT